NSSSTPTEKSSPRGSPNTSTHDAGAWGRAEAGRGEMPATTRPGRRPCRRSASAAEARRWVSAADRVAVPPPPRGAPLPSNVVVPELGVRPDAEGFRACIWADGAERVRVVELGADRAWELAPDDGPHRTWSGALD